MHFAAEVQSDGVPTFVTLNNGKGWAKRVEAANT